MPRPLLLLALALLPVASSAQSSRSDSLAATLGPLVERRAVAGIIAGVAASGQSTIVGAGSAREPGSAPPTDSTTFEIGAISQLFGSIVLAELVLLDHLALDDAAHHYLPTGTMLPTFDEVAMTVGQLASHTSGLPREPDGPRPIRSEEPYAGYDAAVLYRSLLGTTLEFEPGSAYGYSDVGAGLLGHLLALGAEVDYEQLVRTRILEPLGMRDTYIALTPGRAANEARGHDAQLEPALEWRWEQSALLNAGAWRSSARDLLKLARAAISPDTTILGRAIALAMTPRFGYAPPTDSVGLGWHVRDGAPGGRIAWMSGGTDGFAAMLAVQPSAKRAVVVLANTAGSAEPLGFALLAPPD